MKNSHPSWTSFRGQGHHLDLLFELPDPTDPEKCEWVYWLRAAGLLSVEDSERERHKAVLKYFSGRPRKEYVVFGLYLLNEAKREEVFSQLGPKIDVCDLAWTIGLKSASEGRYSEANGWLQAALEAKQPQQWGNVYSIEMILRWMNAGVFLRGVAKRHLL